MAQINIKTLIEIIKNHPDYAKYWQMGVDAETALYINFYDESPQNLTSEVYELKDGGELVMDHDDNGVIYGIEIL